MEPETKQPEIQTTQTDNKATAPIAEPETQEQINWKKFREAREVEKKQRIEAEKRAAEKEAEATALKAAMDALLSKQTSKPVYENNSEDPQQEDEAAKIRRLVKAEMDAEKRIDQQERQQREQKEFPQRLTQTYSDFNQVCNEDNLDYLQFHHPEISDAFSHMPDGFDKWSKIYKAVKRYVPTPDSKKDSAKAEKNFNKPQAMSIAGKTQVGDTAPQQLDDKRRQDNWARMNRIMKGTGS